jgi:hypothetical protein
VAIFRVTSVQYVALPGCRQAGKDKKPGIHSVAGFIRQLDISMSSDMKLRI